LQCNVQGISGHKRSFVKIIGGRNKNVTNGSVLLIEILGKLRNKLNY